MPTKIIVAFLFASIVFFGCKTNPIEQEVKITDPKEEIPGPEITSPELDGKLLFVTGNNFQVLTSDTAVFSANDPLIKISPSGLINRLTSGEVVEITVTWPRHANKKTKFYALGATDDNVDPPFSRFYGRPATDAYSAYKQGWNALKTGFPDGKNSYFIVMRHADADNGKDYNLLKKGPGPDNWWKSCDSTLARQLNPQGRSRAKIIGEVFKDLKYPIVRVISSEFCRAVSTARLINSDLPIVTDGRINHPDYNISGKTLFSGMVSIINAQPTDHKITLITTHHPINEMNAVGYLSFPNISPFNWTGSYLIKVSDQKVISYEGAVSFGMFKLWRDLNVKK